MMGNRTVVGVLVTLGALLGVLAILAVWISRQVLETDQWVDTSSQLLEDPAIQTALSGYLVDQLYANVNVQGELQAALPPRAAPLAAPAAGALRTGAEELVDRALQRPRVQQAWEDANRTAHEALVRVVEGNGDVVSSDQGVVTLDLRALLTQMAQRTGLGSRVADKLPADAASIVILRSDQLSTVQKIGRALKPLAFVLTLLTLLCFAGAIALARGRRRQAVRASGLALVAAGVATLIIRAIAGDVVVSDLAKTAAVEPAAQATWDIGTSLLTTTAWAVIVYGFLVVAGAVLAGPTRPATATRRLLAPYLRDPWIAYGAVAAIILLVLWWGPTEGTRRPIPALILIALFVAGVEVLRRQTDREFPDAVRMRPTLAGLRAGWLGSRGRAAPTPPAAPPAPPPRTSQDLWVARLERLDELHRTGSLNDEEYARAKEHLLSGV